MGCLLYELLTMRPAFSADTIPQVTSQILAGQFAPYQDSDDALVPTELRALVKRLLSVELQQRPSLDSVLDSECLREHTELDGRVQMQCGVQARPFRR